MRPRKTHDGRAALREIGFRSGGPSNSHKSLITTGEKTLKLTPLFLFLAAPRAHAAGTPAHQGQNLWADERFTAGLECQHASRYEKAAEEYRLALLAKPDHLGANLNSGIVLVAAGKFG